jgi:transposase
LKYVKITKSYYCGVDLHSKSLVFCIIDLSGKRILRRKIDNDFEKFLEIVQPYTESIAIALETTFNWYWFYDSCIDAGLDVFLGHAYYMKSIHVDKKKNDRLDAEKIALLLRAGLLPHAYACLKELRSVRDLARRRNNLVYQRSELLGHTTISFYQQGVIDITRNTVKGKKNRDNVIDNLVDDDVRFSAHKNMEVVTALDKAIKDLEFRILEKASVHFPEELKLLQRIPGVGPTIATTILYEVSDIKRFKRRQDFSSYCRLVQPYHLSDGKIISRGNRKCGNAHLKWAFMQIVSNAPAKNKRIGEWYASLKEQHHPLKARAILASQFATSIFYVLRDKKAFDINKLCFSKTEADSLAPKTGNSSLPQAA